jgi:hypothetical protein
MTVGGVWLRRGSALCLLVVLAGAVLTARVVTEGEAELERSDAAFDRGDLRTAVLHARRAAIFYAPGAPHVGAAYARLAAVATGAEAAGQVDVARLAWGAIRGAALETRHLSTPRQADLDRANANLARLSEADSEVRAPAGSALARLTKDEVPRGPWVLVLGLGFGLLTAGLALVAGKGVSREGVASPRWLLVATFLVILGALCWTLAAYRA